MPRSSSPGGAEGLPRWVAVTLLVVVAIILLGVLVLVLTGGQHGPGRHLGAESPSSTALQAR